jgi:hypothetical protein
MKTPMRAIRLVADLAEALAKYHGERRGNFGCHVQAATILIAAGPLQAYKPEDFFKEAVDRGAESGNGARAFLSDILANGPVLAKLIEERGAERGLSEDQLRRAKRKLGIVAFKGKGKMSTPWFWASPSQPSGRTPSRW